MEPRVECYAGARYPERPRAFVHRGKRLTVAQIEGEERTPRGIRFRVRVSDGRRFWLFYDEIVDVWDVRAEASA
jgi:hypothetical protein